ncbi:acyl-CoA thioesterase [Bhargavaea beijingensis]|uniref:acyl-CoA thioesterase n=1 Tax=Bhargavaea beijingensis TaxID=426756 RepID=UPI0022256ACD|nr:thioesterase family protein [Bhargavaea beijingensis]MCW1927380.1 acyl-CoA thioesterase [Bhargavaea beijingensis]
MFESWIEPRVSETDGVGHINNTFIPVWLEGGRNELFRLFTPDHDFNNWRMVIVKMTVEYKDQLYFGVLAQTRCFVKKVGNTSLVLYEEIWQGERKCVEAETVYVNYNQQTKKAETIPDEIRAELEKHMLEVKADV